MLACGLINPKEPAHKLDHLSLSQLNFQMRCASDFATTEQVPMHEVPLDQMAPFAAEEADVALRLCHHFQPKLESMGLSRLMLEVEAPLTLVLADMEANGILCDPDELARQGALLGERVEALRRQITELAGVTFDLNSTRQLGEVLFDRLGLAPGRKTKTGRSTDIEVLEKLAAEEDARDPRTGVPRLIIEYRQLTKLINTYLDNLRRAIHPDTKRIHSTFHQLLTATGRLASQNPNLQNIPVRTDVGRQVRKAFIAPPGHQLICADYSQIELRFLAHFSQDPALVKAFEENLDIHTAVAAQVFQTPLDQVSREQRDHAKTINFGIIYGVTAFGLARRIPNLDVPAASRLIADYKQRFPGLDRFLQQCVHEARDQGYVRTILGRRRAIPEIESSNANTRSLGERLAINSVIQGSAADLIKLAMVNVQRRIDENRLPVKLLLQIHDELVLESPTTEAPDMARMVAAEMEQAMQLRVPLRAEFGIGPDWLSAK
jgi:DNA polymerase-1